MESTETVQKIAEVKGALDHMRYVILKRVMVTLLTLHRRIADISHPSRAAVKVMDFLMGESIQNNLIAHR